MPYAGGALRPSTGITGIAAGPDGAVWVGAVGGLMRVDASGARIAWPRDALDVSALNTKMVLGVSVDTRGRAWTATALGAAVVRGPGEGVAFTERNSPLLHNILDTAYVDRVGRIWLGGAGGVNVYDPPAAPASPDSPGVWLAGFNRYSTEGALPDSLVFTITGDSRGRIWIGTLAGAAVFTPDPAKYALGSADRSSWQTYTSANASLPSEKVHAILEDTQGRIWIGTEKGIAVLDERAPAQTRWRQYNTAAAFGAAGSAPALPHPWVQSLALTPDGRIWAGTRNGLAVFDPALPDGGWKTYRSDRVRRLAGALWHPLWEKTLLDDDIAALAWVPD